MFQDSPTVELLQWLARGSLKQNLARAIRLWALLCFFYGDESLTHPMPSTFSYADWRDRFFTATHPRTDTIPPLHDATCRCHVLTADWLFPVTSDHSKAAWLETLAQHDSLPADIETVLRSRLFAVTRPTLAEDLRILVRLGWLEPQGQKYQRVQTYPTRPQSAPSELSNILVQPDLALIASNLNQHLSGYQRFFIHVDYIVPTHKSDAVEDLQDALRKIWEKTPVVPVAIAYHSAQSGQLENGIVYPVCIYYVQRATYLCAWGYTTDSATDLTWRNYRLDRIKTLKPLTWKAPSVPRDLAAAFKSKELPTPDDIQEQMSDAWGFDFYQPDELMILRFENWFDVGYIQGTIRHETFQAISYNQVKPLIETHVRDRKQRKILLKIWQTRSPDDAYYQVRYRQHDPNVLLRLRAWRPKIEILSPWSLRQKIAQEVAHEYQMYHNS
ncbi:MAG: TIGR03985 family CRISPR-associated protein [Oculatellaceae cyanobacterium Prado106]|jgi:CRISPR-associated protein (TIGR03985 family)|nr:TIGR03985 family CRISPR-associated protein [Oculatellaceae cyanobacterium Prado106]